MGDTASSAFQKPSASSPVASSGAITRPRALVDQQLPPALCAFPLAHLEADQLLLALGRRADQHEPALGLRLHARLQVDTVRPHADIPPGRPRRFRCAKRRGRAAASARSLPSTRSAAARSPAATGLGHPCPATPRALPGSRPSTRPRKYRMVGMSRSKSAWPHAGFGSRQFPFLGAPAAFACALMFVPSRKARPHSKPPARACATSSSRSRAPSSAQQMSSCAACYHGPSSAGTARHVRRCGSAKRWPQWSGAAPWAVPCRVAAPPRSAAPALPTPRP